MAFRYAGFWVRLIATLIDGLGLTLASWVLQLALVGAYYWMGRLVGSEPAELSGFVLQVIEAVLYALISVPYFIWAHYKYQTTFGKVAVKVYVVREDNGLGITLKQSVIRCLAYLLSYLPLGTGYLMAAFNPKKQALHDLIAKTVCVRQSVARSGT
ncbi:MAG TPA: RDD family protein [Bdellovibrionota bacterium]|nr:RDD family protein [Bdellovibrionota bacterium]